ncbi:GGDEF domain-containing protein [Sphingomonas sp. 1P06PA]|uniref:GGDEF domain-containing protein n=1 Tax=Sphingomonas sp. 1P06PA TaxID=554121 RepID=UPI0039A598B5
MNAALLILPVLFMTSIVMGTAMTLAWRMFGRPRHALTWAVAFWLGAAQWVLTALTALLGVPRAVQLPLTTGPVLAIVTLVAIGCMQRTGREARGRWLPGVAIGVWVVCLALAVVRPHIGLQTAIPLAYAAALLALGAAATWPVRGRPNPAELFLVGMIALFALFEMGATIVALGLGPAGSGGALAIYRVLIAVGLPAGYVGMGIAACFVMAADLSTQLQALVTRDPLTGVLNRRGFEQMAATLIANAHRHQRPLALVLTDIDRFKAVNDSHGHPAGDETLRAFATMIDQAVRDEDLLGRLGGDEFCLLMAETSEADAVRAVERIRNTLLRCRPLGPDRPVTASFGIAMLATGGTLADMLDQADAALYASKEAGRDRVTQSSVLKLVASG